MSLGYILLIILVIFLIGGLLGNGAPWGGVAPWGYGYGYSHGGVGIVGVIVIILLILLLTGRL